MKTARPQRGVVARTENKIKRRQNILAQARSMIANDGYGAFTLAELASKAQVTVPTIHNLIGNKTDVCRQLVVDMVERIEKVLLGHEFEDPITSSEAFIDSLLELYASDEDFYKAAFVLGEKEKLFEHELSTGIFNTALKLAYKVCCDAKEQGYLEGRIESWTMADNLFANQRLARHDWVNGYIDLTEYRKQVLTGMFMTFAADAKSDFRERLIKKIKEI
ncbi:TetR/AcrR family transcriptional regulator [Alteromonadaceae bacterium M269]|nr:TetR/AcrR family transcriptional regulator [Alteromonadaceae bacterium M269]